MLCLAVEKACAQMKVPLPMAWCKQKNTQKTCGKFACSNSMWEEDIHIILLRVFLSLSHFSISKLDLFELLFYFVPTMKVCNDLILLQLGIGLVHPNNPISLEWAFLR